MKANAYAATARIYIHGCELHPPEKLKQGINDLRDILIENIELKKGEYIIQILVGRDTAEDQAINDDAA